MLESVSGKNVSSEVIACIEHLGKSFGSLGFAIHSKKRGHFGNVWRYKFDERVWFDALPAAGWVLFYFSPGASRISGLSFRDVAFTFTHTNERKDSIVNVRLFHAQDAEKIVTLIASRLGKSA